MNICGCLVYTVPDRAEEVARSLRSTAGVEIHGRADDGRFVVVVEDTPVRMASDIIMDMHQLPGVVSLTLTYHHFEDLAETRGPTLAQPQAGGPRP